MPTHFSDSYGTKGILENNQFWQRVKAGQRFDVPTDWTIFIEYNPGVWSGSIRLRTWAEQYTAADRVNIEGNWQPTGTSFIDMELQLEQEREEAQREADLLEQVEEDLEAARQADNQAEIERIRAEAAQ
jgi:hypothetical protein